MRDFLKYTFASLLGNLLGLILISTFGIGALVALTISLSNKETGPKVENKSVMVIDLAVNITDSRPNSSTSQAIQQALSDENTESLTLKSVLDSINNAAKDNRIIGILLQGSSTGNNNGLATLREVRKALETFKNSGKKIYAYDEDWSEGEYYLASIADTIYINPLGGLELNGFSSQTMFLAGALQKYGIGVQVVRVGKYKSAVEPFERTQMSPENRQQTQKLLNDLWGDYRSVVGKYRNLSPQQLQQMVDTQGVFMPTDAQKQNLVDKIGYFDEVVAELKTLTDKKEDSTSFRQISLSEYASIIDNQGITIGNKNRIGIVYAEGEIVDGQGRVRQVGGDRLAKQLRQLRLNKDIKAVVLRVNSPGGSATASEVIQREVKLIRKVKPVVVSMGNLAASGGYWISTDANQIFAEATTITGSIGVFGLLPNIKQIANNNGVTWDVVKTGQYADSQTSIRPKTEQELVVYRRLVQEVYEQFLTKVSESRKLSKQTVSEIAQGRVWSGLEAKKLGLVDQIGGLEDAIKKAAEIAKLKEWEVDEYPKSRSLEERIFEKLIGVKVEASATPPDMITAEWQKLQKDLSIVQNFNDPKGIYARLPFNFRID